jgi:hypothetical protein
VRLGITLRMKAAPLALTRVLPRSNISKVWQRGVTSCSYALSCQKNFNGQISTNWHNIPITVQSLCHLYANT